VNAFLRIITDGYSQYRSSRVKFQWGPLQGDTCRDPSASTEPQTTALQDIHGVSKKFGEWYQKTNKTEDTNKLIIAVTRSWIAATSAKRAPFLMLFRRGNRRKSTVLPAGAR
jgi:hypothetical protein